MEKIQGDSNGLWEKIFHGIQDFILVIDEEGSIIDANLAVLKKIGLDKEQIRGKKCYEIAKSLFYTETCETYGFRYPLKKAFKTGKPARAFVTIKDTNGQEAYIEIVVHPVANLAVCIHRDITDFMTCTPALKETKKNFSSISETSQDAIIVLNEELRIHLNNKAIEKIFGYTKEELSQISITQLIPESKTVLCRFSKNSVGNEKTMQAIGIKKGGEKIPLWASVSSFTFKGKLFFTIIIKV